MAPPRFHGGKFPLPTSNFGPGSSHSARGSAREAGQPQSTAVKHTGQSHDNAELGSEAMAVNADDVLEASLRAIPGESCL
jgi:hypothetical protein